MSDVRQITVEATSTFTVDVDTWFTEYDDEWQDFLDGEEETPALREEFIRDTASELGRDVEDHQLPDKPFDTDYSIDVAPRRKK